MLLIIDYWEDKRDLGERFENPSLQQVLDAISALNGIHRTLVSLSNKNATILIGGSKDGKYIVTAADNLEGQNWSSLRSREEDIQEIICFIGGQNGNYRRDRFVSRAECNIAATYFFYHQAMSPDLVWYDE